MKAKYRSQVPGPLEDIVEAERGQRFAVPCESFPPQGEGARVVRTEAADVLHAQPSVLVATALDGRDRRDLARLQFSAVFLATACLALATQTSTPRRVRRASSTPSTG